jgi:hypothetical protein
MVCGEMKGRPETAMKWNERQEIGRLLDKTGTCFEGGGQSGASVGARSGNGG